MNSNKVSPLDVRGVGMTSMRTRRRLIAQLKEQGITEQRVLDAMEQVPRHLFVAPALAHKAYENNALPIGSNQTISQPYIVAYMTQLLVQGRNLPLKKTLEIGTGCGYQSAVLSSLSHWVFSIERIASLQQKAQQRLLEIGFRNISYFNGDGYNGWSSNAPFDGIIVTAAPKAVPEKLLEQLNIGGRLVIPMGEDHQILNVFTRHEQGIEQTQHGGVRFVPMLPGAIAK